MATGSLEASFWTMILLRTLNAVDMPSLGPRKLPSPSAFVVIIAAWIGLDFIAETGQESGANTIGWVIVLVSLVLGPFGVELVGQKGNPGLLRRIAQMFAIQPPPSAPPATTPYPTPIGP